MKITLKLFATLTKYLPGGASKHEVELDVPDGATPAAVITQFNLPPDLTHLVLINGVYVAPSERDKRELKEHDDLAIFPPIAGG
jgi:sulfur-carrier protein